MQAGGVGSTQGGRSRFNFVPVPVSIRLPYLTDILQKQVTFILNSRAGGQQIMDRIGVVLAYREMSLIMEEVSVPTP